MDQVTSSVTRLNIPAPRFLKKDQQAVLLAPPSWHALRFRIIDFALPIFVPYVLKAKLDSISI